MISQDTITALATKPGGAIGIIRVSGDDTFKIIEKISNVKIDLKDRKWKIKRANIVSENNEIVDDVVLFIMPFPNSYTGEDMVEINCHGSSYIMNKILELIVKNGARIAKNGEFTFRAVLNSKMSVTQAEAINLLIKSQEEETYRLAKKQLEGSLDRILKKLRKSIKEIRTYITAALNFPEDVNIEDDEIINKINDFINYLSSIIEKIDRTKYLLDEFKILIVGRTNAGKSSLFNCLLGENRAIVSNIRGTTRDYIKEQINLFGKKVTIIDSAGIRFDLEDEIEQEGINKALKLLEISNFIILLVDASIGIKEEEEKIIQLLKEYNKDFVVVYNKIDLVDNFEEENNIYICAKTCAINNLLEYLYNYLNKNKEKIDFIPSSRYLNLFKKVLSLSKEALNRIKEGFLDMAEFDFQMIEKNLDEFVEILDPEKVLDEVFSNFCIGK